MNKKFSTLLAAALVAGMSVNAQVAVTAISDKIDTTLDRNYVLSTSGSITELLYVDGGVTGVAKTKDYTSATSTDWNGAFWSFEVTAVSGSNRFVLKNKVTGATLSFDPKNAQVVESTLPAVPAAGDKAYLLDEDVETEWTWVSAPNAVSELSATTVLKNAFKTDSTMALVYDATNGIYAVKYANDNAPADNLLVSLQAMIPGSIQMTAADLNILGTGTNKYFTLSTNKSDLIGKDALIDVNLHAVKSARSSSQYDLLFQRLDVAQDTLSERYVHVDTAFHVGTGLNKDKWYKIATSATQLGSNPNIAGLSNPDAFMFNVTRNLFTDSVSIALKQANGLKMYSSTAASGNGKAVSYWQTVNTSLSTYLTLSAIQLTADTEVMTLYEADEEENLWFALGEPVTTDNNTSIADGVYYIKNAKGQYLAQPIHESAAAWVTVNAAEQNVEHMPAFQWVVLKDNTKEKYAAKSPVTIANREFATTSYPNVQLETATADSFYKTAFASSDSVSFVAVSATALADSTMGYKYMDLTADELSAKRYTFNYLHSFATDKYLNKAAADSFATVLNGTGYFVIEKVAGLTAYGFTVTEDVETRIPGLEQLDRASYKVSLPGVNPYYLGEVSAEDKYAFSDDASFTASTFYFKENNCIEDVHYYALVATDGLSKAGVTDDDMSATLKIQVIGESRTSAFNISESNAPLYRRFNSALLEGNEGDASDTLRFVEKYRGEYLQMEKNANFKVPFVDFLGLYTQDYTADGKSFIVDTAWTGNGLKPQYLISIDREDQAFEEGEMCPVCQEIVANGGTRPANCPHDAAGKVAFRFGKYLVNFTDSTLNAVNKNDFAWKGYTRAGFVKAAQQGDSLFILTGQFADWTIADFDSAKVMKAVADSKYDSKYIVNLTGDAHKYVTWSMRFVNPEVAANEVEADRAFLFESMATTAIAPVNASWLKMQNGCLVMSDATESTFNQVTGGDDALIFNVEKGSAEDFATENEVIVAEGITVVAGNGNVTIAGAAGKKVVIANILGQTVANTIITSDNATIAAPAGVVVVKVEGEAAVKAIVK